MLTLSGIKQRLQTLNGRPPVDGIYDAGTYETLARMHDWKQDDLIVDVGANGRANPDVLVSCDALFVKGTAPA